MHRIRCVPKRIWLIEVPRRVSYGGRSLDAGGFDRPPVACCSYRLRIAETQETKPAGTLAPKRGDRAGVPKRSATAQNCAQLTPPQCPPCAALAVGMVSSTVGDFGLSPSAVQRGIAGCGCARSLTRPISIGCWKPTGPGVSSASDPDPKVKQLGAVQNSRVPNPRLLRST
jgi:hypothetical protein